MNKYIDIRIYDSEEILSKSSSKGDDDKHRSLFGCKRGLQARKFNNKHNI